MAGGKTSVAAVAAGASGPIDCGAAATLGSGEWLKPELLYRHPTNSAAAKAPQATAHVANTLILEEFFQVPKRLRGTSYS